MFPAWLRDLAIVSLLIGAASSCVILADEARREQHMWIMYVVWPLCALFGGLLWLWLYWRHGRSMPRGAEQRQASDDTPMAVAVAKGASHFGAG